VNPRAEPGAGAFSRAPESAASRGRALGDAAAVVMVLETLAKNMPQVSLAILDGSIDESRQYEFGELLVEAGTLVKAHAEMNRPMVVEADERLSISDGSTSGTTQPPATAS
jgi:hypothetical protein